MTALVRCCFARCTSDVRIARIRCTLPRMRNPSRRSVLRSLLATGVLAGVARGQDELVRPAGGESEPPRPDPFHGLKVGVASYSLRGMKLDEAIESIQRVGLKYVSIKDIHLPMNSTPEERKAVAAKFKDVGLTPLSVGVVTLQNDEAKIRSAFEYTRDVGAGVMVCNPHPESFPILDKLVKEFATIRLAIHNHGPESDRFKSPYDAMKAAEQFDERIGVCVDVGHTARMKED